MPNTETPWTTLRRKGRPRGFDRDEALTRALDVFWHRGYELASVTELCAAMGINPPSLYAAFNNKAKLFLEAVDFYERTYWDAIWDAMNTEPDVYRAIGDFFEASAHILLSPDAPCGCLVALAAVNVSPESVEVSEAIEQLRQQGKELFVKRLRRAVKEGQLPARTDIKSLAAALNTMLEGMSIQARDGLSVDEMTRLAAHAVRLLPDRPSA
ncbi:TetR/AcrR family transcriptional regulator [Ralstonia wenshanensis]|uniref:HTH-type transcriptional repressor ComR n=1 Tax=Ralstonia wenshanensis TaxID=2842456 RepID=A0AAD2B1G6_9RALS|nr:TetR/AcrR family transcriptional regulator [Ralstonia wenshanensis]CAJ0692661.1 HTH-type transcriptional repressor ComR [Ralstonia wenshanensis]